MTEITLYKCDVCGAEYRWSEDADACEAKHSIENLLHSIHLYNEERKSTDPMNKDFDSDSVYYIQCDTIEAAEGLRTFFDKMCMSSPFDHFPCEANNLYWYDNNFGNWRSLSDEKAKLDELERDFCP